MFEQFWLPAASAHTLAILVRVDGFIVLPDASSTKEVSEEIPKNESGSSQ
jgi:hypothetical protein